MAELPLANPVVERSVPATLVPIRWRVWPVGVNSVPGVFALISGSATVVIGVYWVSGRWELAALAWGAVALASWRLLLPVSYELSFQGLCQRFLGHESRLPWPAISRVEIDEQGLWLWSHDDEWSGRRSLGFLPWGNEQSYVLAWFESRRLAGRAPLVIEPASSA